MLGSFFSKILRKKIMEAILLKQTYDFANKYHSQDCSGHDFEHIKRVYANVSLLLSEMPHCNVFVVKMSALLHDIDDHKLCTDGKNALRFLQGLKLERNVVDEILSTISAIGFSTSRSNPNFSTIEMKLLSDADKLDAIGAIGVCRTIMFGACHNTPLFNANIFPNENLSKDEYKNISREDNNSINHFFDKLLKLKNAMQTEIGKKEAQKRHDFMVTFLNQFFKEQNLEDWQNYLNNYLLLNS